MIAEMQPVMHRNLSLAAANEANRMGFLKLQTSLDEPRRV